MANSTDMEYLGYNYDNNSGSDAVANGVTVESANAGNEDSSSRAYLYFFQAINIVMIITIMWVLANMIIFGKRTRKWRSSTDKTKVDSGNIFIVCIVAVGATMPRLVFSQLLFHEELFHYCEVIMDLGIAAYSISLWLVYFFLWLRHRAIYAHPTVKQVMGKYSNCISWFLLSIVTAASLAVTVGFVYPVEFTSEKDGCVLRKKTVNNTDSLTFWDLSANYILGGFLFVSQFNFLLLFIYPMIITRKIRKEQRTPECNHNHNVHPRRHLGRIVAGSCARVCKKKEIDSISAIIYRSVVSSTIAVSTDLIVAFLVAMVVPGTVSRAITVSLYDMSLVINVLCMLATFGGNSKILFTVCRQTMSRSSSSSSLNSFPKSNNRTASTEMV